MKITAVRTAHLGGNSAVTRVDTDVGIQGYGEGVVEPMPHAVLAVIERIGDQYLVGKDPRPVEKHRRNIQDAMWYQRGAISNGALTGIVNALLDIKAKALDIPVYELLGGPVRDRVRGYKWIGENIDRSQLVEGAQQRVDEGFDAMKFSPTPTDPDSYPQVVTQVREIVADVREAVGPDVDLMLDPASRFKLSEAKHILEAIEPYDPLFAEDFISPHHIPAVEKLSDSTRVPYALGDRLSRLREFEPIIQQDAAAVLQPDMCHSGDLLELKRIAGAAEHHGIRIAPHNPQGPIATAAAVHLDLTIPNFLIQELAGTDEGPAEEYIDAAVVEPDDGYIEAPEKPGFGVSVDDRVFEEQLDVPDAPLYVDRDDFHVPEW